MTRHKPTGLLLGVEEISRLIDRSRGGACYWVERADFPPAADVLHCGRVWRADDVAAWLAGRGQRRYSETARAVLASIGAAPGPVRVADLYVQLPTARPNTVRTNIGRLLASGDVTRVGRGRYTVPGGPTGAMPGERGGTP